MLVHLSLPLYVSRISFSLYVSHTTSTCVWQPDYFSSLSLPLLCLYAAICGIYHNFTIGPNGLCGTYRWQVWREVCICESVHECMCMLMCMCVCRPGMCVCWPWRYTMGHLYRPSAPTKLPLGVGVLTMFWTISSNKSQPKLLVSVSLAKWQTVHPPKSLLLWNGQEGRRRQTKKQIPRADPTTTLKK